MYERVGDVANQKMGGENGHGTSRENYVRQETSNNFRFTSCSMQFESSQMQKAKFYSDVIFKLTPRISVIREYFEKQ